MKTFIHDPNEVLDYVIDWADFLGADTIATSTWVIPTGLTNSTSTNNTTQTSTYITVSAGQEGKRFTVTNRITTAGGRTADRSIELFIESR